MKPKILSDDLHPETPLVRYLRMGAFLALLKGQMFVPSLRQLQTSCDPTEGLLSSTSQSFPDAWRRFVAATESQLLDVLDPAEAASISDVHKEAKGTGFLSLTDKLTTTIALSRAILCFYTEQEEDMAMWQLYARDGVAIETTPSRLEAIEVDSKCAPHIARVRYNRVGDDLQKDSIPLIARPHLFKLNCYSFERETRWVLVTKPCEIGVLLKVNPRLLIKRVRFSPFMHPNEAKVLKELCKLFLDTTDVTLSPSRSISPVDRYGVAVTLGSILKTEEGD